MVSFKFVAQTIYQLNGLLNDQNQRCLYQIHGESCRGVDRLPWLLRDFGIIYQMFVLQSLLTLFRYMLKTNLVRIASKLFSDMFIIYANYAFSLLLVLHFHKAPSALWWIWRFVSLFLSLYCDVPRLRTYLISHALFTLQYFEFLHQAHFTLLCLVHSLLQSRSDHWGVYGPWLFSEAPWPGLATWCNQYRV